MTTKVSSCSAAHESLRAGESLVRLGAQIAEAGEGRIYEVAGQPDFLVKLYREQQPVAREHKLQDQIQLGSPELHSCTAWPLEIVHRDGRVAGFLMRRVTGIPIHQFYHPKDRASYFPRANWNSARKLAVNVARVFDILHRNGIVMGDINGSNLLVNPKDGIVSLIDCDSYQIPDTTGGFHPCPVGTPEWIGPELQGCDFSRAHRTPAHDAFGLGLLMFHLLNNGWHPFQGRPVNPSAPVTEGGIAAAIRKGHFAFSIDRKVPLRPPGTSLQAPDFPRSVWCAFESAFGNDWGQRPSAAQWETLLDGMAVTQCSRNPAHFFPADAGLCPWCRIRNRASGPEYFPGGQGAAAREVDIQQLAAELLVVENFHPGELGSVDVDQMPKCIPTPMPANCTARSSLGNLRSLLSGFGARSHADAVSRAWSRELDRRRSVLSIAVVQMENVVRKRQDLRAKFQREFADTKARSLGALRGILRGIEGIEAGRADQDPTGVFQEEQRAEHLQRYLLQDLQIPHLGERRRKALVSVGIRTAADVNEERLMRVPNVGPSIRQRILEWVDQCMNDFQFDASRPLSVAGVARLRKRKEEQVKAFRLGVSQAERALSEMQRNAQVGVAAIESELIPALERVAQAKADLLVANTR